METAKKGSQEKEQINFCQDIKEKEVKKDSQNKKITPVGFWGKFFHFFSVKKNKSKELADHDRFNHSNGKHIEGSGTNSHTPSFVDRKSGYDKVLNLRIKNKSEGNEVFTLFSLFHENNPNIEIIANGNEDKEGKSGYGYFMKLLSINPVLINSIRIHRNDLFKQLDVPIEVFNENCFGQKAQYFIIPLLHFSCYQYQSNLVDVQGEIILNGKNSFRMYINPLEEIGITLFVSKIGVDESGISRCKDTSKYIPIILDNYSDIEVEFSLFDRDYLESIKANEQLSIKYAYPNIPYEELLDMMESSPRLGNFTDVIVYSPENKDQVSKDLTFHTYDILKGADLIQVVSPDSSPYQFQNNIIEVNLGEMPPVIIGHPVKIKVLPCTKVCYVFSNKGQSDYLLNS